MEYIVEEKEVVTLKKVLKIESGSCNVALANTMKQFGEINNKLGLEDYDEVTRKSVDFSVKNDYEIQWNGSLQSISKSLFKRRLQDLMKNRNMQTEELYMLMKPLCKERRLILEMNDIKRYLHGFVSMKELKKLEALADFFDVPAAWLFGV